MFINKSNIGKKKQRLFAGFIYAWFINHEKKIIDDRHSWRHGAGSHS